MRRGYTRGELFKLVRESIPPPDPGQVRPVGYGEEPVWLEFLAEICSHFESDEENVNEG